MASLSPTRFLFDPTAIFNYVLLNNEGFFLTDTTAMYVEHTVFAGNLRAHAGIAGPRVFDLQDDADLDAVNILAYDNDQRANPGVDRPYDPLVANTPGYFVEHATSAEVSFDYSTFVYNESDLMFNFGASSSSRMSFDHTYLHSSWGKVFSASVLADCPLLNTVGSVEFDSKDVIDQI